MRPDLEDGGNAGVESRAALYSGWCEDCATRHELPRSAAAIEAARGLLRTLESDRRFGREGKMIGVLVGEDRGGSIVALQAFSGLLDGNGHAAGFVGPTRRAQLTAEEEASTLRQLSSLSAEIEKLDIHGARAALAAALAPIEREIARLSTARRRNKQARSAERLELATQSAAARLAELKRISQREAAELRAMRAERDRRIQPLAAELERRLGRRRRLRDERRQLSRALQSAMHAGHGFVNFAGNYASLARLFTTSTGIPSGAGECCAPKLLQEAARRQIRPLGVAELWCGPPPPDGSKRHGQLYGPCAAKCQVLLGHLLCGAAAPRPPLIILFEDEDLIAVDKPAGLLSVPGRGSDGQDCAQTRLENMRPELPFVRAAHRLDQATSGVLLLALNPASHRSLSSSFQRAAIRKDYQAIVGGIVEREHGEICIRMRADLAQRPRQVVDPIAGANAHTSFRVLLRRNGTTRLALTPHSGRTHQLRVHCAEGLGTPIVGDTLYGGAAAPRLMLHAQSIELPHPATGARVVVESPVPF